MTLQFFIIMLYLKKFKTFEFKLKKEVNQMSNALLKKEYRGYWEKDNLPPFLSPKEEKELFQRLEINSGDKKVKDKIVERNTRLVRSWARKIKNSYSTLSLEFGDLCQEGVMGLMKAVNKFDWKRGNKFSTYAVPWINQAIRRNIDNKSRTIRIPVDEARMVARYKKAEAKLYQELKRLPLPQEIAEEMKIKEEKVNLLGKIKDDAISLERLFLGDEEKNSLIDFIEDKKIDSPSVKAEAEDIREKLKEILSSLDPREEKILMMRFGLEDGKRYTLEEAGKVFSITEERARQIQKIAIRKLGQNPQLRELLG